MCGEKGNTGGMEGRKGNLIEILMRRDEISREEAIGLIREAKEAILDELSDKPLMDILGLEPDYLMDVLDF